MSTRTSIQHIGIGKVLETRALAVPPNQRSYSWGEKEIDDLWTDLKWSISDGGKEYFLGTIVLTTQEGQQTRPLVVDGQQRLASVSMIYAAIRDYLLTLSEDDIAKDIKPFLTATDRWTRTQTAKLELSTQDSLFFQRHVLADPGSDDRESSTPTKSSPDSHKRIAKAFKKISGYLSDLLKGAPDPLNILKSWDKFLQDGAKLIVLEVDDESSAFQIFETLNDRGLDLAVTDLLKNYLFGKAGPSNFEQVRHHWTTAMSRIGDGDERSFKRFVHHFWSSKHGLTRERLLYTRIKESIKTAKAVVSLASQLSASACHYSAILNSDADFWTPMGSSAKAAISTLKDLKLEQYKPLLLACMDTMDANRPIEFAKLLRALVSWSVRFRVTQQFGSSKLEDFYGNGGKLVRDKGFKSAKEIIDALKGAVPSDIEFRKAFQDFCEPSPKIARYYLFELESLHRKSQQIVEMVDADEQVNNLEHILPREPDFSEWPLFTSESANAYVFRLGNQVLLSKKTNEKLGNAGYSKKHPSLKKSEILTTKYVEKIHEWNEQAIDQRQIWLAELAVSAWPVNG